MKSSRIVGPRNGMGSAACLAVVLALPLVGCSGGDGEVPTAAVSQFDYSSAAAPRHSYSPHQTGSHVSTLRLSDDITEVYIGGDLEPRERLRHVATTQSGIRYFMGASRDGVGGERLSRYAEDLATRDGSDPLKLSGHGFRPFYADQPSLYVDPDLLAPENAGILQALGDSIRLLNDALPPEFQIVLAGTRATDTEDIDVGVDEIVVSLETPASISSKCGSGAVACAENFLRRYPLDDFTGAAVLYIPDDFDVSDYTYARSTIVHELLHALGIQGHVDSIEFPDSIMGEAGEYIPNLGHIISKIDREVLQIMYMSQRTDLYNDWDEWSDTSFHVLGRTDDGYLNFGVTLFNGLPQPWVRGVLPDTDLADNRRLNDTATWNGNLLGFSGPAPIAGDAQLQVRLHTLNDTDNEQDLRFRDIYYLNRFESESSDRWFHTRDMDYKVNVSGNLFQNVHGVGYEQGHVTGAFLGPEHEHMGGTIKRTDMVAAFGGGPVATSDGSTGSSPTSTSADIIPTLVRLVRGANSLLVSDVLDFYEDPPARWQSSCGVGECTFDVSDVPALEAALEDLAPSSIPPAVTIEPVAERRGVSLFRVTGPYLDENDAPYEDDWYVDLGGWLDHSFFLVEADFHRTTGPLNGDVEGSSIGSATGTNPLSGGATWSGVMVGRDVSASAARGNEIQGNADLTIGDFADPRINVALTNISDADAGRRRADMTWDGVSVRGGGFSTGSDGNSVQGQFYGPNHEEVGGTFERDQVMGAFGATRQ